MIENVGMNGLAASTMDMQGPEGHRLTEDQKGVLEEILAGYDPTNFSSDDEKAMRTELRDAGIFPGRELGTALDNAGFDVKRPHPPGGGPGRPGGAGGPGGPPPRGPVGYELTTDQKDILEEILATYDPADFSEEDRDAMSARLKEAGIFPGRELGTALENAGFEISRPPMGHIPNGMLIDNTV
ncbi:MAG: hypothetical protein GY765_06220 [bacterium]|nr:hypothetical protein [bacterium]